MPWRLGVFIILFVVFFLFIVFNLENKCVISFGFTETKEEIPVFVTAFFSFIVGMFCVLPFVFGFRSRKKAKVSRKKGTPNKMADNDSHEQPEDSSLADKNHYGID